MTTKTAPTTPPDFTEQAQLEQRAWQIVGDLDQFNEFNVVHAMIAFASEAATQGQMAYIERVRQIANSELQAAQRGERGMKKEFEIGAAYTALVIRDAIIALSPDPSYLDRVRSEAATAALEQAVQVAEDYFTLKGNVWVEKYGNVKLEDAIRAIAAIGDDRR